MKKNNKNIKIAVGGLIFHKNKILLCKSPKWSNKWVIPGGKMKENETIEDTVKREVKEETGLSIDVKSIGKVRSVINPSEFTKGKAHFLLIDTLCESKSAQVKLDEEHSEYKWVFPEESLKMDLLPYSKKPIEDYLKRKSKEDYLSGWQRCKADFENYKKKALLLTEEAKEKAQENLILEIIPILDNFNLAVDHIPEEDQSKGWVEGILYIKKQFENILEQLGIEEIKAENQEFDPSLHECIEESPVKKEIQKGKVVELIQKGYQKNGKVIRAAKVKVGK